MYRRYAIADDRDLRVLSNDWTRWQPVIGADDRDLRVLSNDKEKKLALIKEIGAYQELTVSRYASTPDD